MNKSWLLPLLAILMSWVKACGGGNCYSCNYWTPSSCDTCNTGYYRYYNSTTGYYNCGLCIDHCYSCTSSSQCDTCNTGYYKNSTGNPNVCLSCHIIPYCIQCSGPTTCTSCAAGFYINSTNLCKSCPLNCKACNNSGYCSSCKDGFYATGGNCVSCIENCKTCSNPTNCTACIDGYYFYTDAQQCKACPIAGCKTCTSDPLACSQCLATNNYYNSQQRMCKPCVKNCKDCSGTTYCTTCSDGFVLDSNSKSCKACIIGCQTCSLSSIINCTTCFAIGYYKNASSKCVSCTPNCKTCDINNCSICIDGYFLGSETPLKLCKPCHAVCRTCSSNASTACISCYPGYFLDGTTCTPCHQTCITCNGPTPRDCLSCGPYGVLMINKNCKNCSTTEGCLTCKSDDPDICLSCVATKALSGTGCFACAPPCQTCLQTNPSDCLTCISSYKKFPNRTSCYQCTDINCDQCMPTSPDKCLKCKTNFTLTAFANCTTCQFSCQACTIATGVCTACKSGFYLNATSNLCIPCQKGCSTCDSTGCLTALGGIVDSNKKILQCMLGCISCNNTQNCSGSCVTTGYYKNNNVCNPCPTGCLECTNNTSCNVNKCMSNFIRNSTTGLCVKCADNCATCYASNITKCASCTMGYQLNLTEQCARLCQLQGCALCNSDNTECVSCNKGFALRLQDYKCVKCLKSCTGTCDPTNITTCLSCIDGFYLSKNTCVRCPVGCKTCDGFECASTCLPGYTSTLDSSGNKICTPICKFPCIKCSSYYSCEFCATGYDLIKGVCQLNTTCTTAAPCTYCPRGTYISSSSPLNCTKCVVANCSSCPSGSGCVTCLDGFYLDLITEPANPTCKACDSRCLTCNDNLTCIICSNGYVKQPIDLSDPANPLFGDACIPCDANCKTCTITPQICLSCYDQMRLVSSRCVGIYTVVYEFKLDFNYSEFLLNCNSTNFTTTLSTKLGIDSNDNLIDYIKQGSTLIGGTVSTSSSSQAQSVQSSISNTALPGFSILSSSSTIYYGDDKVDYLHKQDEAKKNVGLIIGIAIGSVVFVVVGGLIIYACIKRSKSKEKQKVTIEDVSQGEIDIQVQLPKSTISPTISRRDSRRELSPKKRKKKPMK